jgi:Arylsulfotransferase (ASST)
VDESTLTRGQLLAAGAATLLAAPALSRTLVAAAAGENVQRFVSRPDLKPPTVTVTRRAPETAPGYLFMAPSSGPGQRGAMIFDDSGELVWFHPVRDRAVTDFKVALYHGRPVLTWWEGKVVKGLGEGEWVVVDASYRELARFSAARGRDADLHEFVVSPQGTALVTSTETVAWNLASVGGSRRGRVVGGVVQELELPTGRLLHEWRSLDHVAVDETEVRGRPGPRFDYFHVNSIDVDVDADGDLIVSARNTWAAYKVARRDGRLVWRLGGKRSDFALGPGTRFYWQHDVRRHAHDLLTVFDNAAAPAKEPQSRALVLRLDERRRHVSLVRAYTHRPGRVLSHFMGNAQLLADGHVVVGWGAAPYLTEFAADGSIVFDAALPHGGQSYRAFRFPWTGRPSAAPALVAAGETLHASWNGATGVASWQLLEGDTASTLRATQTVPRTGFETRLQPRPSTRYAAAAALDAGGAPLARSATVAL